ncbi:hypothetical protein F5876DRAFT_71151 [Lentinula aff. lateritia]|uniref:Uncharacterized protein n=1 Tax=Lentinula aff. lateritia TaxID=2804960 RepID=A0ACC1TGF7_9AGAR|nr:hypothetical protein F5876DRAFT_71151 [Lentinula aff. lateritia]
MEILLTMLFGLCLRFVLGSSPGLVQGKLYPALLGVWEGVCLRYLTTLPPTSPPPQNSSSSLDALLSYAVRLCIDYFITESVGQVCSMVVWSFVGVVVIESLSVEEEEERVAKRRWKRSRSRSHSAGTLLTRQVHDNGSFTPSTRGGPVVDRQTSTILFPSVVHTPNDARSPSSGAQENVMTMRSDRDIPDPLPLPLPTSSAHSDSTSPLPLTLPLSSFSIPTEQFDFRYPEDPDDDLQTPLPQSRVHTPEDDDDELQTPLALFPISSLPELPIPVDQSLLLRPIRSTSASPVPVPAPALPYITTSSPHPTSPSPS